MHILLLEPDRQLAMIYFQGMMADGHTVTPTASAQAAVLAADKKRPDVVVLELQLIEHSGIEFLYEFRSYSEWQDIPVIVHSQVPPHEFAANDKLLKDQLGIGHFLYKPHTSIQQLLQAVGKYAPVTA